MIVLVALAAACAPSETSIVVTYPTPAAREATKRIAIYAFDQDSAARSRCRDYVSKLPSGEMLGANPVDDPFILNGEKQLTNFPAGEPVVLVVALNSEDPTRQKPILQGCTDTYGGDDGFSDVPVQLEVIVPSRTAMTKVSGDHVVGQLGAQVTVTVRVDTAFDMATQRDRYVLPAVPLRFSVRDGTGLKLGDAAAGAPVEVLTDANGLATVLVTLPNTAGTFTVGVASEVILAACMSPGSISAAACKPASETQFVLSSVRGEDVHLRPGNVVQIPPFTRPVAVAIGNVTGGQQQDAVVLGCDGTDRGCMPGRCAGFQPRCDAAGVCEYDDSNCLRPDANTVPDVLGTTRLAIISDIAGAPSVAAPLPANVNLGVTPGGLFVGPLVPSAFDDVAIVNSRRSDCQTRRCEGSEMLVFGGGAAGASLTSRQTMTASNAVALAGVRGTGDTLFGLLLTAAQGRSRVGRLCNRSPCLFDTRFTCPNTTLTPTECRMLCIDPDTRDDRCVDDCLVHPETCGCPPQERCECVDADGCPGASQPGACIAQDKFIDRLTNEFVAPTAETGFSNRLGCQQRELSCVKDGDGVSSGCTCLDEDLRGNNCLADDACGCKIPSQISIGDQAGVVANDVAVGRLQPMLGSDVVAASEGGIDFLPRSSDDYGFRWSIRKTPMSVVHFVRTVKLSADEIDDVLWVAKGPCQDFNMSASCPLVRPAVDGLIDGVAPAGCMGLFIRKNNVQIDTTTDDGCRRFLLPVKPAGVCTGDVNGDAKSDVIIGSYARASVLVYLGDNNGGLLDPPIEVDLPSGGTGGIVACAVMDGDGLTDIVTLGQGGVVSVLTTAP